MSDEVNAQPWSSRSIQRFFATCAALCVLAAVLAFTWGSNPSAAGVLLIFGMLCLAGYGLEKAEHGQTRTKRTNN